MTSCRSGSARFPAPAHAATCRRSRSIMRPLGSAGAELDALDEALAARPRPFHLVVVGGGASGCELALAIHQRLGRHAGFRLTLLQGNARLLPQFPPGWRGRFASVCSSAASPSGSTRASWPSEAHGLLLDGGERVACDAVLWATRRRAAARSCATAAWPSTPTASCSSRDTLQSVSDPAVFGTGDCVSFDAYPDLPRNGVYAVREGAVLFDNVAAFLREEPLRPFRPQRCSCAC